MYKDYSVIAKILLVTTGVTFYINSYFLKIPKNKNNLYQPSRAA